MSMAEGNQTIEVASLLSAPELIKLTRGDGPSIVEFLSSVSITKRLHSTHILKGWMTLGKHTIGSYTNHTDTFACIVKNV